MVATSKKTEVGITKLSNHPTLVQYTLADVGVTRYQTITESVIAGSPPINAAQFDVGWVPTGTLPSPTAMRSNQLLSGIYVVAKGITDFGVVFGTGEQTVANADSEAMVHKNGAWAARHANISAGGDPVPWTAWEYGIPIQTGAAGTIMASGLDSTKQYVIYMMPTHLPDAEGMTSKWEIVRPSGSGTEGRSFWEVTGFIANSGVNWGVDVSGTFYSIGWNKVGSYLQNKKVLIIGDSQTSGYETPTTVEVAAGQLFSTRSPTYQFALLSSLSRLSWSEQGALGSYVYKALEEYFEIGLSSASTRGGEKILEIMNLSWPGAWQAKIGPNLRTFWEVTGKVTDGTPALAGPMPGLYGNPPDNYTFRWKASSEWVLGTDWIHNNGSAGTWTPDLIIIESFTNDMIQRFWEITLDNEGDVTDEKYCGGGTTLTINAAGLVSALKTAYPSAKFCIIGPALAETTGFAGVPVDTVTRVQAAFEDTTATYHDFRAGGADSAVGRFELISTLDSTIDTTDYVAQALHPNVDHCALIGASIVSTMLTGLAP